MGDLIDDLLDFSRIGRAETNKSAVDLEQLVREVVAELGQETKDREIAWKNGPLPICYGDRSMLKVVLMNLLSNAVKFTRIRKRAEIEIGCADGRKIKQKCSSATTARALTCSMSINSSACFNVCTRLKSLKAPE